MRISIICYLLDVVPIAIVVALHWRNFRMNVTDEELDKQNRKNSFANSVAFSQTDRQSAVVSGIFQTRCAEDNILMQMLPKLKFDHGQYLRASNSASDYMKFTEGEADAESNYTFENPVSSGQ